MEKKVLVVDDEPDVTELLDYKLRQEGYSVSVINDPLLIMGEARQFHPDLVVLDIMMPELNGIQICRMLRADPVMRNVPVIFLTARGEAEDRVKGFETGADDYISKPFDSRELLLRIQALFKRLANRDDAGPAKSLVIGRVVVDIEKHRITVAGNEIDLTATEFKLLRLLIERKGRVQSRENLLVNVWNYEADIETRTVDTHIRRLREKLGHDANIIQTVRGVGYRVVDDG
ncbi:response regulator transcription factor [Rubellicoccus peritrichatus]|uniref:Phosphate regulon transcriptional regulatory protein PhoB n=1 Tax=Rubellicoccus peritrichatus TaxID=3080537 RepID=A0AAQ3LE40_9BACT|nr:response regulator transcription factor [Puniceicoccus sp. CR14]WOO42265.1 response regulator transcription factor [Puniceicoccus sp. CR14]